MSSDKISYNILLKILTYLSFRDRYKFCISSYNLFNELFKEYNHPELIEIKYKDHKLTKIWKNIKFKMNLLYINISDVSMLDSVHTLNLSFTNISDVSMLGKVHTLNLSFTFISDVFMLNKVHTLDLTGCKNITDVSMLGNVHSLNISHCYNITNISMLDNVKKLTLKGCKNIKYHLKYY